QPQGGFQRADVNAVSPPANRAGSAPAAGTLAEPAIANAADTANAVNPANVATPESLATLATPGFLVNGSVNNGAASPFAQLAAFGNNRRGGRSLYNGGFGAVFGGATWGAPPFSFTGQPTPKPTYEDVQLLGSFAGP